MNLSRSHLYHIKKEKNRRAHVIAAKLCREFGSPSSALYIKTIKRHMSLEWNHQFGIQRLEQMADSLFPEYIKAVHEFRFCYGGKIYG